jgi:serine/threonine protein kinase
MGICPFLAQARTRVLGMDRGDYWLLVEDLLAQAIRLTPAERSEFLEEITDTEVRAEVASLVAADLRSEIPVDDNIRRTIGEAAGGFSLTGRQMGRHQILERIAVGGMSEVYLGRDPHLNRKVAIKVLPPGFQSNHDRVLRFQREATATSSLNHPSIVTIYDIGQEDGRLFIAMEHVEGESLQTRIRRGPLSPNEAAAIGTQIASALGAAHAAGIVHRDIKPGNIMIRPDGLAKVLDFGLAHTSVDISSAGTPETMAGTVLGTPAYMSPEQARGKEVTPASDLWSFGAVLYEMLTATPCFRGGNTMDILVAVLEKEPVRPSSITPAVSPAMERLVLTLLSKDPAKRPASGSALSAELQKLTAAPKRSPGNRRIWLLALGVLCALAMAAMVVYLRPARADKTLTALAPPIWSCSFTIALPEGGNASLLEQSPQQILTAKTRFRVNLTSPKDGYIYLLDESASTEGSREPEYTALFPTPSANGGSAHIGAAQSVQTGWLRFDGNPGEENVWLVWGKQAIPELEALRPFLNTKDKGVVRSVAARKAIASLLKRPDIFAQAVQTPSASKNLEWTTGGDLFTASFELRHR